MEGDSKTYRVWRPSPGQSTRSASRRDSSCPALQGEEGEDLVEKHNAEQGLMPLIEDEALTYGYTHENRHMVAAFRRGQTPSEALRDGLAVTELLMAAYLPVGRAGRHHRVRRRRPRRVRARGGAGHVGPPDGGRWRQSRPGGGASPSARNLPEMDGRRAGVAKRAQPPIQPWEPGGHLTASDVTLRADKSGQFRLVFSLRWPVGVRDAHGGSARVWREGPHEHGGRS
jgi:hypothetical protein